MRKNTYKVSFTKSKFYTILGVDLSLELFTHDNSRTDNFNYGYIFSFTKLQVKKLAAYSFLYSHLNTLISKVSSTMIEFG